MLLRRVNSNFLDPLELDASSHLGVPGLIDVLRKNGDELAMLDAADCGNPYAEMVRDANAGAAQLDFYAGLVTEMKGASIPMGPDRLNFSVREPLGVVGRIVPFNHPFMFIAGKAAAPLAAGNTIVMKPPEQAPLSSLRLAELIDGHVSEGGLVVAATHLPLGIEGARYLRLGAGGEAP